MQAAFGMCCLLLHFSFRSLGLSRAMQLLPSLCSPQLWPLGSVLSIVLLQKGNGFMWPGRNLKHPGKMAEEGWPLHLALRETRQAGRLQASCPRNFRGRLRVGGKKLTHYRNKSRKLKIQTSSSQIFSLRRSELLNCLQCFLYFPETKHGCTRTEVSRQLANLPSLRGRNPKTNPTASDAWNAFK